MSNGTIMRFFFRLQAAKEGWTHLFTDEEGDSLEWPKIKEMMLKRWTGHAAAAKKVVVESGPLGGGPARCG